MRGEFHVPEHLTENAVSVVKKMLHVDAEKRPTTKEVYLIVEKRELICGLYR